MLSAKFFITNSYLKAVLSTVSYMKEVLHIEVYLFANPFQSVFMIISSPYKDEVNILQTTPS